MEIIKTAKSIEVYETTVYLFTIKIGDGQKGNSAFLHPAGGYVHGGVKDKSLGEGAALKGKSILVSSMVTDVNPYTNNVSMSYLLNDEVVLSLDTEAAVANGSVFFETKIVFA